MTPRSYFDHAASSPMSAEVAAAMTEVLGVVGNPGSLHQSGRTARRRLEEARESLAADLGADPTEVVFTSGGTEANNLALLSPRSTERSEIAISAVEHPSVSGVRALVEKVAVLPVDRAGVVDLAAARPLIGSQTALVSVMLVNNETGAIQPVAELTELAHNQGALAHSDAVQAPGHLELDFRASGLDLMSVSAHKLGGPVGIGALLVRRQVRLKPLGFGGGQERGLRPGTAPVALAVGFAAASRLARQNQTAEWARLEKLREALLHQILADVPNVKVNSASQGSPAILNLTFPGARADDLLLLLDAEGIDASTGSACTAGLHQPSEVLMAMGRTLAEASSSLRFSFGPATSSLDVDRLTGVLPQLVSRARAAQPEVG